MSMGLGIGLGLSNAIMAGGIDWSRFLPNADPTPQVADTVIVTSSIADYPLSSASGFDMPTNGGSFIFEFEYDNWEHFTSGFRFPFNIGNNSTDYIVLKITSGYIYTSIVDGGSTIKDGAVAEQDHWNTLIQHPSNNTGRYRLGVTMRTDGSYEFALNGFVFHYTASGSSIPNITSASSFGAGKLIGTSSYNMDASFQPVQLEIFNSPLTRAQLEDSTYVSDYMQGSVTKNEDLWIVACHGQSNMLSDTGLTRPVGYSPTATNRKMIRKDLTVQDYSSPYTQFAPAQTRDPCNAFNQEGGWSGMEKTIDALGLRYTDKKFATLPINRGGTGYEHSYSTATGNFTYNDLGTGTHTSKAASPKLMAVYLNMLVAKQLGNILCFVSKGGETDGLTGSTVTESSLKSTITEMGNALRLVMPKVWIQNGLHAAPPSGYSNWAVPAAALPDWVTESNITFADKYYIDNSAYVYQAGDEVHLDSDGQLSLGTDVANKIIEVVG